jgi:hypothetical protein
MMARLVGINHAALEVGDLDGIPVRQSGSLDVHDPWGNYIQVVDYREIQFTKAPDVLSGMRLDGLDKAESARQELRDKGLGGAGPSCE